MKFWKMRAFIERINRLAYFEWPTNKRIDKKQILYCYLKEIVKIIKETIKIKLNEAFLLDEFLCSLIQS